MATLDQMFPDFLLMTPEEQGLFFEAYHARRSEDLLSETRFSKKESKKGAGDKLQDKLSAEELLMMKKLGLKMKDITSLIAAMEDEGEETIQEDDEEELIEE